MVTPWPTCSDERVELAPTTDRQADGLGSVVATVSWGSTRASGDTTRTPGRPARVPMAAVGNVAAKPPTTGSWVVTVPPNSPSAAWGPGSVPSHCWTITRDIGTTARGSARVRARTGADPNARAEPT